VRSGVNVNVRVVEANASKGGGISARCRGEAERGEGGEQISFDNIDGI
jgi:hypothetical protein